MSDDDAAVQDLTTKGRATRQRIVLAAAELMWEQGVAATSLQDVQQATRVSGSQLYHYFKDKASLVHAVVACQRDLALERQGPWLSQMDSLDGIRAWRDYVVSASQRRQCRGGCPIGTLASELSDIDPEARSDLAEAFARWSSAIRAGLEAMQARGDLAAAANPTRLSYALLAAGEGGLLLSKAARDPAPLEAALDTVIDRIAELTR